jgi:hypothetical protein
MPLSTGGGDAIGAVASAVIGAAFASSDAKKRREMEAELANLSLAQQKELELNLQNVKGELAKQEIIYNYLAIKENNESLAAIKNRRYAMYIVVGLGVIALSFVALKLSQKK